MRIKKTSAVTTTNGSIIDSLDGSSTTDAPSVNAVNNKFNEISSVKKINLETTSNFLSGTIEVYKVGHIVNIALFDVKGIDDIKNQWWKTVATGLPSPINSAGFFSYIHNNVSIAISLTGALQINLYDGTAINGIITYIASN